MIVQDYCQAFKRSLEPNGDQGFFLCGQMCVFLHHLLRRVVKRSDLPDKSDWEKVHSLDIAVEELLSIPEFMQRTELWAKALKVAKCRVDVERERGKKAKSDVVARNVTGGLLNPFLTRGDNILVSLQKSCWSIPVSSRTLLSAGPVLIDGVLFVLPKTPAVDSYRHIFQSFSSRGCLARELRLVHLDDYVEFVDEIRHIYWMELNCGPTFEDMVCFLSSFS